jgi:hypothetical protein
VYCLVGVYTLLITFFTTPGIKIKKSFDWRNKNKKQSLVLVFVLNIINILFQSRQPGGAKKG